SYRHSSQPSAGEILQSAGRGTSQAGSGGCLPPLRRAYRQKFGTVLSTAQRRVMKAIELCRTAALGGHVEVCDRCGHQRIFFNSCSDRHCPKCQSLARAEWIENRQSELLDVPYFHVVFTVPEEIADIAFQNKRAAYDILFRATAETLTTIAADPQHLGAKIGFFAVLHTWGQTLLFEPSLMMPGIIISFVSSE